MSLRVHRPQTLEELCLNLAEGAQLLGGGTVLIPRWNREQAPSSAVTLERIPLARLVTATYVGAAVTLEEMAGSDGPAALRAASRAIGTSYLRSQATVGGNLGAAQPGCLLTALAGLDARAQVLYGENGRQASVTLEEARAAGSVILGLEWVRPVASRYRKLRSGRAGRPEFAVAMAAREQPDRVRLTAAVWSGGLVTVAHGVLAREGFSEPAKLARALFPKLAGWQHSVVASELQALLTERRDSPAMDVRC